MKAPYGLLWPVSAFSMGSIARSAEHDLSTGVPVQLARIDEPERAHPVSVSTLNGSLRYLGREDMILAGQKWNTSKFELKVPLHGPFLIWTSPEGLLLGFANASGTENKTLGSEGMQLVRFRKWLAF